MLMNRKIPFTPASAVLAEARPGLVRLLGLVILGFLTLPCIQGCGNQPLATDGKLTIRYATLKRDYGNALLTLHLHPSTTEQLDKGNHFSLVTDSGEKIAVFALPSRSTEKENTPSRPIVSASPDPHNTISFWLEERHLGSSLRLQSKQSTLMIKTEAPFELTSLDNAEILRLHSTHWTR